ncbi:MAG: transposase family protein [Pedosphaera sp.]|nr:transposase family protein [Pedosphaera sp.]
MTGCWYIFNIRTGCSYIIKGGVQDQNLQIKTFVGTSANAVRIQIWTALIAVLVVRYLQFRSNFAWAVSNLVALLRWNLFIYRNLWEWLNRPLRHATRAIRPVATHLGQHPAANQTTCFSNLKITTKNTNKNPCSILPIHLFWTEVHRG